MTTLKVGIASYEEMKARSMAVARGERRVARSEPKVWFTSTRSLSPRFCRPAIATCCRSSPTRRPVRSTNWRRSRQGQVRLSRTLRTMEGYGLVRLERGERGRIIPKVMHDRVELDLPLTLSRKAS